MASRNPAFSRGFGNAGPGQQYAGWGNQPQYGAPQYGAPQYGAPAPQQEQYAAPSPYGTTEETRYMTMDDVVTKTGLSFLVTVVAAALTWAMPGTAAMALALPAVLVALVLGLVIAFKQIASPVATLSYGALYGVALGAISEVFSLQFGSGIVMQALIGTFGVFAGMLVIYKTGAIRVTPKLTRWIVGALIGVLVLVVVNLLAGFFVEGGLGLRDGGPLAIVFSLVVIGVAAFTLLLDFDMADEAIRRGAPAKFAWYIAFGLLITVIWLYLEILRLLSYFQDE
ncbi:Bax inhibitor-1/YccA family membrane protein [Blastococcus sp. SYSU DS1024]